MKPGPALRALLTPLSSIYGAVVGVRNRMYQQGALRVTRLNATVISVGNITAGGTGKTPMVMWLASRLMGEGRPVGILSRGYKGEGGLSDEVLLLRSRLGARVKVVADPHRARIGGWLAEMGWKYLILDDGFQHRKLARDADIVLLDARDPFGGGHLLPSGLLREPVGGLARADVIVITRSESDAALEEEIRRMSSAPIFYARTRLEGVYATQHRERLEAGSTEAELDRQLGREGRVQMTPQLEIGEAVSDWRSKKWFAFCGIGNPDAYFCDLRNWGAQVSGLAVFPDHHGYSERDREVIERDAIAAGADALLCTEKDLYNLGGRSFGKLALCVSAVSLDVPDGEQFWDLLKGIVESRRPGAFQ